MNALQVAGLLIAFVVLLAMALVLFAAAQAGGYGALSRFVNRRPIDLDEADGLHRRSRS